MSEEEKFENEESEDVEAHRRRALTDEPAQQEDTDESDDVEAHRRRA